LSVEFMEERREVREGVNLAIYSLSRREREGDGGTEEGVGGGEVWLKRRGGVEGRLDMDKESNSNSEVGK
jgi:hypothetical protein